MPQSDTSWRPFWDEGSMRNPCGKGTNIHDFYSITSMYTSEIGKSRVMVENLARKAWYDKNNVNWQ